MVDYWSLVIFTILGQSAAGIMMLLALSRRATRSAVRRTWVAVIILIAAAVASSVIWPTPPSVILPSPTCFPPG